MTQRERLIEIEEKLALVNSEKADIERLKFELREAKSALKHWTNVLEFYQEEYAFVEVNPHLDGLNGVLAYQNVVAA